MEHPLRCNSLKCRKELVDQAVVTTCSHIFCLDCANRLQLSHLPHGQRPICPACEVHLNNPDDAVLTNLNPTEDYKTSVLSGLSPHIIMECAGRALSFWAYQSTQELVYHDYLGKTLTDKYQKLTQQLDKVVHDANSELHELRGKVSNLHADQELLRKKNTDLLQAYSDKNRQALRAEELYDRLKKKALLGQVQDAALEAADHTIHASALGNRYADRLGNQNMQQRPPLLFSDARTNETQQPMGTRNEPHGMNQSGNRMNSNNHPSIFSSQESHPGTGPSATPSSHRQRLTNMGTTMNTGVGINMRQSNHPVGPTPVQSRFSPSGRSPLGGLSGNAVSGNSLSRYGMSAGAKFSQPLSRAQSFGGDQNRQSSIPPRVAQRPASGGYAQGFLGNPGQNLPNSERYF